MPTFCKSSMKCCNNTYSPCFRQNSIHNNKPTSWWWYLGEDHEIDASGSWVFNRAVWKTKNRLYTRRATFDQTHDTRYLNLYMPSWLSLPWYQILVSLETLLVRHSFVLLESINISSSCCKTRIFLDVGLKDCSTLRFLLSIALGAAVSFWVAREGTSALLSRAVPSLVCENERDSTMNEDAISVSTKSSLLSNKNFCHRSLFSM
jgi:hypothetical protein